jgi:two-component system cell cycle sensor histidine kinase/response regulator CckA
VTRPVPDRQLRLRRDPAELARLRLAVEASGEIIFMTDTSGTFTYVNPEFTRVYGFESSDVIGRVTPRILSSGTTTPAEYAEFWCQLKQGQVVKRELLNRTRNGTVLHIESSANPIVDGAGVIVGFLAVQRDVTERKALEGQLLQSQKMEAVGRLAGGIAHDFNNLLTAIMGYSDLLEDRLAGSPDALADLAEIKKAGERASRLTRQFLAFSRKQPITRQIVDMNALVADINKMLSRVVGEDVELLVVAEPTLPPVVADPGQLEQVLVNLVVNSRDAMPNGGRLTIATAATTIDEAFARRHAGAVPGPYVCLIVADVGCGMTEDVLGHVFEPFFTTKPQGQGTGLGLSTVYGIVKQNGGYITIASGPGRGTTVTIFWPVAAGGLVPSPSMQSPTQSLQGTETILLVEDEAGVRSLMRKTLQSYGYDVLEARDVHDALTLATTHQTQIHLVLSDVIMPGMNGPDLAQRIVAERPAIKVLYVSGFPSSWLTEREGTRRRIHFLAKPFAPQALVTRVRECLDL